MYLRDIMVNHTFVLESLVTLKQCDNNGLFFSLIPFRSILFQKPSFQVKPEGFTEG